MPLVRSSATTDLTKLVQPAYCKLFLNKRIFKPGQLKIITLPLRPENVLSPSEDRILGNLRKIYYKANNNEAIFMASFDVKLINFLHKSNYVLMNSFIKISLKMTLVLLLDFHGTPLDD